MDKISFKSIPKYYEKEEYGDKPNTIRKIEFDDPRLLLMLEFMAGEIDKLTIEITNTKTHGFFEREISDISVWEGLFIISWYKG